MLRARSFENIHIIIGNLLLNVGPSREGTNYLFYNGRTIITNGTMVAYKWRSYLQFYSLARLK